MVKHCVHWLKCLNRLPIVLTQRKSSVIDPTLWQRYVYLNGIQFEFRNFLMLDFHEIWFSFSQNRPKMSMKLRKKSAADKSRSCLFKLKMNYCWPESSYHGNHGNRYQKQHHQSNGTGHQPKSNHNPRRHRISCVATTKPPFINVK